MQRAVLHMPSWFPGARFKRCAREWALIVDNALQRIFDKVKGDLVSFSGCSRGLSSGFVPSTESVVHHFIYQASGTAAPSVAANMISKLGEHPTELELFAVKGVPGSMYIAGADTVSEEPPQRGPHHFFKNVFRRLSLLWRHSSS
jgi:hypothetical protein